MLQVGDLPKPIMIAGFCALLAAGPSQESSFFEGCHEPLPVRTIANDQLWSINGESPIRYDLNADKIHELLAESRQGSSSSRVYPISEPLPGEGNYNFIEEPWPGYEMPGQREARLRRQMGEMVGEKALAAEQTWSPSGNAEFNELEVRATFAEQLSEQAIAGEQVYTNKVPEPFIMRLIRKVVPGFKRTGNLPDEYIPQGQAVWRVPTY